MLTADELISVVRVHADRVHDAVRRLGCSPEAALEVVETSAHDLVDAESRQSRAGGDPVGWWFARARALGRAAAGTDVDGELPLGGGVLSSDASQVRLAEALELRPERERAALLLRDSYDLPAAAVGTALGLDADGAMGVVGAARLAFLPALLGGTAPSLAGHPVDLPALARLAEGGPAAARDATTRRHAQSCSRCADVLDAQERARRLLSGLTVVALPDADREALLARVEDRARRLLPAAELDALLGEEEWEDEPHRWYSLSLLALGVLAALGLGVGAGVLLSRGSSTSAAAVSDVPLVTAAPVIVVPVTRPSPTAAATTSPTPRVFVITPSPTPPPTQTPEPTTTASATETAEPLSLQLSPSSGPNDTVITVTGTGWTPGAFVQLVYRDRVSQTAGATTTVQADAQGRFSTTLTAHDAQGVPGPHDVVGGDGTNQTSATFTAS